MKRLLLLQGLLLVSVLTMAQADPESQLKVLQENFDQFSKNFPQERVYLHFDNTSYFKGEHIYYKAYVVNEATLKPSDLSRVLYVELVNPIGYPVETQKLMVRNGQTSGSFLLKDTLNAGFYEVRAYTSWMLNFAPGNGHGWRNLTKILSREFYGERLQHYLRGNAGIFSRVFPVYEQVMAGEYGTKKMPRLPKATASLVDKEKDKLLIDFYPEGGNMVRGVPTRVAFQARSTTGRKLNIEGKLMRNGKEVGVFKTEYGGRGVFSATTDESDEKDDELLRGLKLEVNYNGKDYKFSLPKAQRRGYVLNVLSLGDVLRATVARNSETKGEVMGMSVTSRGVTIHSDVLDLRQVEHRGLEFKKKDLQTGVNIFTLYNKEGKVIAQREVFVNNHDMDGKRLRVIMPDTTQEPLKPYGKVMLQCQLVDQDGQPIHEKGKFSLAVTDKQYHDGTYDDGNVLSYLLLSSEVKGFIPHPEYYFEKDDREHRMALDLLMMVQGWTRYDFEAMMSGKKWEPLMAIERGLNFRGRLVDDHGEYEYTFWKPLKKPLWIYNEMYMPYKQFGKSEIKTDSLGFFMFNYNPFFGDAQVTLMVNQESAKKIGEKKAGIIGHSFSVFKNRRPSYLVNKHIIPLNPYSPVARNYDYYETRALEEGFDKNVFLDGFMAKSKGNNNVIFYDDESRAFIAPEVKVVGNRRWSDFRNIKPVAVIDVYDMMAHLSNVFGSINDFHYFGSSWLVRPGRSGDNFNLMGNDSQKGGWWHPGAERDGSIQNNFSDDMFFADMEKYRQEQDSTKMPTPTKSGEVGKVNSQRVYNKWHRLSDYNFDVTFQSYYNYYKLLMLLGLDGMNNTFVDSPVYGNQRVFVRPDVYGTGEYLAPGMEFFPADVNFSKLYLYADTDDRSLIHQEGRYFEQLVHYYYEGTVSTRHPLTSIINFKMDYSYPLGFPQPDFIGFRIKFQGFSVPDEFYHVDYSEEPLPMLGDYRRTVYWDPSVVTDENGLAQVTFYNNSFTKQVTVSAEGLTDSGIITMEK